MKIIFVKNSQSPIIDEQIEKFASELFTSENSVKVISLTGHLAEQGTFNGVDYQNNLPNTFTGQVLNRLRALFTLIFSSADIIHIFGEDFAWPIYFSRFFRLRTKFILTLDSAKIKITNIRQAINQKILRRIAKKIITTRAIDLRHQDLNNLDLNYIPHPIYPKRVAVDDIILKAHRLSAQHYILALVNPNNKSEIHTIINNWQNILSNNLQNAKLAIAFTEQEKNQELAVDPTIEWLGYLSGESADIIFSASRAVITPNLRNYHYQTLRAYNYGKFVYPIQEIIDQSPIIYHDLANYIDDEKIELHQLNDIAHCMSLGHLVREAIEMQHHPKNTIYRLEFIYAQVLLGEGEFRTIRG